jgi:hypothetical protein
MHFTHYVPTLPSTNQIFQKIRSSFRRFNYWQSTDYTNFEYLYTTDPDPLPKRDVHVTESYQHVVLHALRKHLYGWDYNYITQNFHRPEITDELFEESLKAADLPDHPLVRDASYIKARTRAKELFTPPEPIRPVHLTDLLHYDWNKQPSAELPFTRDPILRRKVHQAAQAGLLPNAKMNFGNLENVIFDDVRQFVHDIKRGAIPLDPCDHRFPPDRLHVKTLVSTRDKSKLRIIFGRTKRDIFPAAQFFWPYFRWLLYDRFSDPHNPLLWGCETLLGGWQRLHSFYTYRHLYFNTFISVDWSKFDQRALFSVIDDLTEDWKSFFRFDAGYIPTFEYPDSKTDPVKLERLFEYIRWSIKNIPFLHPSGKVFKRLKRFIPSGLFVTQMLDSHYNTIMCLAILDEIGIDIDTVHIRVQGDDSITAIRIYIPSNQHEAFSSLFASIAKRRFDANYSIDKSKITNTPEGQTVLGYTNSNGYPSRDWRALLATLLYPKSPRPTFETLMTQCPGLQYASIYQTDVVRVTSDIFNYLQSQGFKPTGKPSEFTFASVEAGIDIDSTRLPTRQEVERHLRSPPLRRSPEKAEKYWNSSFFLATH